GERQPGLGYRVQQALHALGLVFEAIHPHFSRYRGAPAIGSSSALYVLRPTSGTRRALEREPAAGARIYSQGGMARGPAPRRPPGGLGRGARSLPPLDPPPGGRRGGRSSSAGDPGEPVALAGEGWGGVAAAIGLPDLWRLFERHAASLPAHRPPVPG